MSLKNLVIKFLQLKSHENIWPQGGEIIMDYKEMYFKLFNKISDVINELTAAQQEVEEIYISEEDDECEGDHYDTCDDCE